MALPDDAADQVRAMFAPTVLVERIRARGTYKVLVRCPACGGYASHENSEAAPQVLSYAQEVSVRTWLRTHECRPVRWALEEITSHDLTLARREHEIALIRQRDLVEAIKAEQRRREGNPLVADDGWRDVAADALRSGDVQGALDIISRETGGAERLPPRSAPSRRVVDHGEFAPHAADED